MAYHQRTNFASSSVGARGVRLFRSSVAAAGDRATLVWNRRVTGRADQTFHPQALTLSNLDLLQYDDQSDSEQASSASPIDNVEQVRATAADSVVYKVKNQSTTVDGLSAEPFAVAATNPVTEVSPPRPIVTVQLSSSSARSGDDVTVTQTVTNSSGDLDGRNAQASLILPAGVTATSGGSTSWTPGAGGTLGANEVDQHTWTVHGTSDGLKQLTASASLNRVGETFTGSDAAVLVVDSAPPSPTIACPSGGADSNLAVSWGATDDSRVQSYDVDLAVDGSSFQTWLAGTTDTSASYAGAPGHSYAFRLRARDALGNVSGYVDCAVAVAASPTPLPGGVVSPPNIGSPVPSRLRILGAKLSGSRLRVSGTLVAGATGLLRASLVARHTRPVSVRLRVRSRRFLLSVRLPSHLRHVRRAKLTLHYGGDSRHAAQTVRRTLKFT